MYKLFVLLCCLSFCLTEHRSVIVNSKYPWLSLPITPALPSPIYDNYLSINNVSIWYTMYGPTDGIPVLFLHGGLANSDYWGLQVEELKSTYRCILMDSRGHGRSTMSSDHLTYDLMTNDVLGLLDYLAISKTHLIGWSDGAIIGLNLAMKYSDRLMSLFAFGANYVHTGSLDISKSIVFNAYLNRTHLEYEQVNPSPNYTNLFQSLMNMYSIFPNWTAADFEKINTDLFIWIVDGDHEEVIARDQPDTMFKWIPQSGELILPRTSHFAFLQDADGFTAAVKQFLINANFSRNSAPNILLHSTIGIVYFTWCFYYFLLKHFAVL